MVLIVVLNVDFPRAWKYEKSGIWRGLFTEFLNIGSTELNENETHGRGYSRGFGPYPMYYPHIFHLITWAHLTNPLQLSGSGNRPSWEQLPGPRKPEPVLKKKKKYWLMTQIFLISISAWWLQHFVMKKTTLWKIVVNNRNIKLLDFK